MRMLWVYGDDVGGAMSVLDASRQSAQDSGRWAYAMGYKSSDITIGAVVVYCRTIGAGGEV